MCDALLHIVYIELYYMFVRSMSGPPNGLVATHQKEVLILLFGTNQQSEIIEVF
jgi:hypothetical protein